MPSENITFSPNTNRRLPTGVFEKGKFWWFAFEDWHTIFNFLKNFRTTLLNELLHWAG